jgi:cysteine synthase B
MTVVCEALQGTSGRDILAAIGNTPLIRLARIERELDGVELYAKAEWFNPGGSVKDRPAGRIICEAIKAGHLTAERRILDATSGNTGIAYAMIGAALGYGVTLCVPANITPERRRILKAYGPELIFTDPLEGSDGAIREARKRFAEAPARYFYADQYNNPFNWRAHYENTAVEIWEQTRGRVTHLIAGLGTSGSFVGTGRRLRELNPAITLASVQPDAAFHGLEGLKHMESAIVPGIYDPTVADHDLRVATDDAHAMVRRLAGEEGLLIGISSGAALVGALRLLQGTRAERRAPYRERSERSHPEGPTAEGGPSVVAVVIFPDGGERYLSESFWDDEGGLKPVMLDETVIEAIRDHGKQTYPHECCGALIGLDGQVSEALALPNTTEEGPRRRFLVRPEDYRAAESRAAEGRRELLGFYHSHPDHPAQPSQYDLDHALPFFSYVIVSVREGEPREMRSWRLRDDRSQFDEETITSASNNASWQ